MNMKKRAVALITAVRAMMIGAGCNKDLKKMPEFER